MSLPEEFLNDILSKNDIVSTVSSYVNLKNSGRSMVGLCPFHSEKTPSFRVYAQSDSFYCFGCCEGGSVITFIQKIEALSFIEAVKFLAQKSGISFPENKIDDETFFERTQILEANREAARFYHSFLRSDKTKAGINYLKSRGLEKKIIVKFGLGFAPGSGKDLVTHLKSKNISDDTVLKSGLGVKSYTSSTLIDRFKNRLMFPIIDQRGNVVAFGGRAVNEKTKPKYLNSPETFLFKKRSHLFSLNFAKKSKENFLILTEGYMDVISLHKIGITNVVATLGTAISKTQANLISRLKKEVVIAYDSDEAGQKATERAIEILKDAGLLVKVMKIDNFKDPDEFIKNNKGSADYKFSKLVKNSTNDVEYRLKKLETLFDKEVPEQKINLLKEGIKILSSIKNDIEREVFLIKFSSEMKVSKEVVKEQVKKYYKKSVLLKKRLIRMPKNKNIEDKKLVMAQESILRYLIFRPLEIPSLKEKLSEDFFEGYRSKVYKIMLKKSENHTEKFSICDFHSGLEGDEVRAVSSLFAHDCQDKDTYSSVLECIDTISKEKEKLNMKNVEYLDMSSIKQYTTMLKKVKK